MAVLKVSVDIIQDAVNIKNGVYAPVFGFLRSADYQSVLVDMRLADGQIWPLPIAVPLTDEEAERLRGARSVTLVSAGSASSQPPVKVVLKNIKVYPISTHGCARDF